MSELRRLLYVALTRPIFKLYIPKVKIPPRSGGYLGPVGTILLPALNLACPVKLGPLIAEVSTPALAVSTPKPSAETAPAVTIEKTPYEVAGPLFPPLDDSLHKRRIVIRSFSSMARHHLSTLGDASSFGEQAHRPADEAATPIDRDDPLRGPVFGDIIHNVLERIDFLEVARSALPEDLIRAGTHARKLIDQEIKGNLTKLRTRTPLDQLAQACRQQIAALVWGALRTPLSEVGGPLCDVPAADRLTEVEFLFPERSGAPIPANQRWEEGFVTGFMDLLFRKNDKYYLLDWKTNMLPAYGREQIERSMADSDYHRQYRLYLQAIARWLRRVKGPTFPFLEQLGGVYYLYVRGLNGRDESSGVFCHHPTEQDLDLDFVLTH